MNNSRKHDILKLGQLIAQSIATYYFDVHPGVVCLRDVFSDLHTNSLFIELTGRLQIANKWPLSDEPLFPVDGSKYDFNFGEFLKPWFTLTLNTKDRNSLTVKVFPDRFEELYTNG